MVCAVMHAEAVHKLYMYSQINHSQTVALKSWENARPLFLSIFDMASLT